MENNFFKSVYTLISINFTGQTILINPTITIIIYLINLYILINNSKLIHMQKKMYFLKLIKIK